MDAVGYYSVLFTIIAALGGILFLCMRKARTEPSLRFNICDFFLSLGEGFRKFGPPW